MVIPKFYYAVNHDKNKNTPHGKHARNAYTSFGNHAFSSFYALISVTLGKVVWPIDFENPLRRVPWLNFPLFVCPGFARVFSFFIKK